MSPRAPIHLKKKKKRTHIYTLTHRKYGRRVFSFRIIELKISWTPSTWPSTWAVQFFEWGAEYMAGSDFQRHSSLPVLQRGYRAWPRATALHPPGLAPSSLESGRMGWWVAWGKGEQTSSAQIPEYALESQAKWESTGGKLEREKC